jgi:hypothetical protein
MWYFMNGMVVTKYFESQGDKRAVPMTNNVQCKLAVIALCLFEWIGQMYRSGKQYNAQDKEGCKCMLAAYRMA